MPVHPQVPPDEKALLHVVNEVMSSDLPKLYCNSFINALGINDVTIILQQNGKSVASLNLSLITAKSMALKLTELVQRFEAATNTTVPTSDEVAKLMAAGKHQ